MMIARYNIYSLLFLSEIVLKNSLTERRRKFPVASIFGILLDRFIPGDGDGKIGKGTQVFSDNHRGGNIWEN